MKAICLALLFTVLVVSVTGWKRCRYGSDEDCGEDECCVYHGFWKGHRCEPIAKEGEPCKAGDEDERDFNSEYHYYCPCAGSLVCEAERIEQGKYFEIRINQRCVDKSTTSAPRTTELETGAPPEE